MTWRGVQWGTARARLAFLCCDDGRHLRVAPARMLPPRRHLSQKNVKPILIFDEIDNGVGGKTANAIGRRLLAISKNEQIFAITHSPQVAALADTHFKVQKGVSNNETFSTVSEIDSNDKIEEIARMLSGNSLTDEARKMAKVLISD